MALGSGRFRFRHDSVLKVLAHHILLASKDKARPKTPKSVEFVQAGSATSGGRAINTQEAEGILSQASDWILLADVGKSLIFPSHIYETSLRPDIVLYSNRTRVLIIIELTCPMEENLFEWNHKKTVKYADLVEICRKAGWTVHFFAVEVGARGYASVSLKQCLGKLGLYGKKLRSVLDEAASTASRSSFWIWVKREEDWLDGGRSKPNASKPVTRPRAGKGVSQIQSPQVCSLNIAQGARSGQLLLPRGVINVGNTCFLNASIQSLKQVWDALKFDGSVEISNVLTRTIQNLKIYNSKSLYPLALVSESRRSVLLSSNSNSFEDAFEFVQNLCTTGRCVSFNLLLVYFYECLKCKYFLMEDDEVFGITCEINSKLESAISSFLKPNQCERLCPRCPQDAQMSKTVSILDDPDVLLIQLERFTSSGGRVRKLKDIVQFPLVDFVVHSIRYNLAAVVNHIGSLSSGHYTAHVLENSQWYLVDDHRSSPVDSHAVCSVDAYLLFYKKVT